MQLYLLGWGTKQKTTSKITNACLVLSLLLMTTDLTKKKRDVAFCMAALLRESLHLMLLLNISSDLARQSPFLFIFSTTLIKMKTKIFRAITTSSFLPQLVPAAVGASCPKARSSIPSTLKLTPLEGTQGKKSQFHCKSCGQHLAVSACRTWSRNPLPLPCLVRQLINWCSSSFKADTVRIWPYRHCQ